MPFPEPVFDQEDLVLCFQAWVTWSQQQTREESPVKPCALTVKEGGSPKEIWALAKEKEMPDGQKNKYAHQWTIKKMMSELNFKDKQELVKEDLYQWVMF